MGASRSAARASGRTRGEYAWSVDLIAHGGHALYDHPAMMAISLAAIIIPLVVLGVVAKIFVNSAKRDRG